jgi:YHS domain-containing protein
MFAVLSFGILLSACASVKKGGTNFLVNLDDKGVMLDGYDPVGFFTDKKPVKGVPGISFKYHDATYFFANEENKKKFVDNPAKYEPQYGGYCGYAVSLGHLAPIDVNFFTFENNRLVLQHNQRALDGWKKDAESLQKANKYWPKLSGQNGKPIVPDEEKHFFVNRNAAGFVAEGYDVVAYFTEGKPVKGDPKIIKLHNGAFYAFATEAHKQMFGSNPDKYVPLYGGFCAYAVSVNKLRPIDPQFFQIVDDHLLLQHSQHALDLFGKDIPGNKKKADGYWPEIVKRKTGDKVEFDAPAQ